MVDDVRLVVNATLGGARVRMELIGEPTRADIRRLVAMLAVNMEVFPEGEDDPKVLERLEAARGLLYPAREAAA
ncbi:MAG TPA: hypothetical protein VFS21_14635 [Roseiflexaceae bacterium]|nr:hypothetical protein [Roseiflexaceae bacterium]